MLKQIQKTLLKLLEKELMLVLAVLILALCTFWVRAAGDSITFNLSVFPAAGTITITYPNGGENWKVNTTETITWTTQGPVNNVKIELQREAGDSWEELIDSTIDDGSFPWPVTAPVTTTALIKISKVGDASVTDTSDAVFTISTAEDGDDGGNGHIIYNPAIDTVIPREFSNTSDVEIIITGFNFEWGAEILLNNNYLQSNYIWSSEISITVPADFPIGNYTLCVVNLSGGAGCYHLPIVVYLEEEEEEEPEEEPEIIDEEEIIPPTTGGEEEIYSAKWIKQSHYPVLEQGEEATLWVDFKNTGNVSWTAYGDYPVKLGTSRPLDRISDFKNGDWLSNNRSAKVQNNGFSWLAVHNVVQPGEIGRFTFTIRVSNGPGKYREYFRPVVEYKTWMEDWGVYWDITVESNTKIKYPVTGGTVKLEKSELIIEREVKSSENKVFIDVDRQYPVWLNRFLSWLGFI